MRRRFYWWNNAAVRVHDDSRIHYPMRWTASHGFAEVDTWPVNQAGRDLSLVGNHIDGPVSVFSHGSREAFMGVYHPWSKAGVVHYSSPEDAPTKKIWSFGGDADGIDWRRALSDDKSAYVEVQAGLFRNQETYGFLEPQETIRFTEYWMPVRAIGGITRANPEAVVNIERKAGKAGTVDLSVGVNVSRAVTGGRLRVQDGTRVVHEEPIDLTPAQSLVRVQGRPAFGPALHRGGRGRRWASPPDPHRRHLGLRQGVGDPAGPADAARGASARPAQRRRLRGCSATPRSATATCWPPPRPIAWG